MRAAPSVKVPTRPDAGNLAPDRLACLLLALMLPGLAPHAASAERWSRDADGRVTIRPLPLPADLRNPWPEAWEREFQERANHVIRHTARDGGYGNTFFENEKRSYGWAMLSLLGGYKQPAVAFLQSQDHPGDWSTHTLGIDYYPCFTLKHQVRKYFFFGPDLDAEYRATMKRAAAIWTEKDPLRRPHHAFKNAPVGWGPDKFNSWVDVRSTDNLKLMRDVAVYLMAEETGNEETRLLYRQRLRDFLVLLYYQGQGEWDSENYLGHGIAPLLNLHDFARDPEVRALAKASLDWMVTCAAVKYWRGGYNGPSRRDYNHPYPLGGSAAALCWMWFGDTPRPNMHFESDEIHVITSGYRPPAATIELARKNFARPLEIIAGKPEWACWEDPDAARPTYRETHYFGRTFQFGTLVRGTQGSDINGFKALVASREHGAESILAAPVSDPTRIASPQYTDGILAPHSAVGQNGNLAIYLTQESNHPYLFLIPESSEVRARNGVTFVHCEQTSVAIWPINLSVPKPDAQATAEVQFQEKKTKQGVEKQPRWPHSKILRGDRLGPGVYGFAIEFHEGDRNAFERQAASLQPELDGRPDNLAASLTAVSGRRVRLQWGNTLQAIKIWRDGRRRDFDSPEENVMFRTLGDQPPLIDQPWQGDGTLRVEAGGRTFRCTVDREGRATFSHGQR